MYLDFSDLGGNWFTQRAGTGQSRRKGQERKCKSNLDFSLSTNILFREIFLWSWKWDINQILIIFFHKIFHFFQELFCVTQLSSPLFTCLYFSSTILCFEPNIQFYESWFSKNLEKKSSLLHLFLKYGISPKLLTVFLRVSRVKRP